MEELKINLKLNNVFQLEVTIENASKDAVMAIYLLKGKDVLEKTRYTRKNQITFSLERRGSHRVKIYQKIGDNIKTYLSDPIIFNGMLEFSQETNEQQIFIDGVNKEALLNYEILKNEYVIQGFIKNSEKIIEQQF